MDTAGFAKDSYYFYQSQWNDQVHTLHVLPAWNENVVYKDNSGKVPVVVYSDAASVELFFTPAGGERQSLGKKAFTQKTTAVGYTYQIYEGEDKNGPSIRIFILPGRFRMRMEHWRPLHMTQMEISLKIQTDVPV